MRKRTWTVTINGKEITGDERHPNVTAAGRDLYISGDGRGKTTYYAGGDVYIHDSGKIRGRLRRFFAKLVGR